MKTLEERIETTNEQPRLIARLSIVFGLLALILAAIGIYGVLSYGVARRTNEIGIRMALGAARYTVVWMVLRETGLMLAFGLVTGIAAAAAGTRLIASRLYGVEAMDPLTTLAAIAILGAISLIAGWIPAMRAARIDPLTAVRHE